MGSLLSKYQEGFWRGFNAKNCQLEMLERLKLSVDKEKAFGVLLTDLSKAFHYLSNELIQDSVFLYKLKLIQTCLTERKYRTKINQV